MKNLYDKGLLSAYHRDISKPNKWKQHFERLMVSWGWISWINNRKLKRLQTKILTKCNTTNPLFGKAIIMIKKILIQIKIETEKKLQNVSIATWPEMIRKIPNWFFIITFTFTRTPTSIRFYVFIGLLSPEKSSDELKSQYYTISQLSIMWFCASGEFPEIFFFYLLSSVDVGCDGWTWKSSAKSKTTINRMRMNVYNENRSHVHFTFTREAAEFLSTGNPPSSEK